MRLLLAFDKQRLDSGVGVANKFTPVGKLLLESCSPRERRDLALRVAAVEVAQNISAGQRWTSASASFAEGFSLLKAEQVGRCVRTDGQLVGDLLVGAGDAYHRTLSCVVIHCGRYQGQVMDTVFLIQEKRAKLLTHVETTREKKSMRQQVERLKRSIRSDLDDMYCWQRVDGAADKVTEEHISAMLVSGEAPWGNTSASPGLSLGKQYHRLNADRQRCEEELLNLEIERQRLKSWLEAATQRVAIALGTVGADSGKAILLRQHLNWMQGQLAQL